MTGKRLIVSLVLLSAILVASSRVLACSCGPKPTVLESFEGSNIVVTTHLVSVDKIGEKQREYDIHYIRSVTMVVDKVYKGNVKPGQVLKFAQGGGADCIWTFDEDDVGDEFLFYLGQPTVGHPYFREQDPDTPQESMYYAGGCGRSRGLKGAWDDVAYLNNLKKVQGRTRLSGQYGSWDTDKPIGAGLRLKIIGKNKTYETKTDKNGFFEIYDLPPGDYTVVAQLPFGWKINQYMLDRTSTGFDEYMRTALKEKNQIPIRITEKRHTALDLLFDNDTAIKGKVISPTGRPMEGVCIMAVSSELKEGDYRGQSGCTDEKGEFSVEEMAPGNFLLVANDDGKMSNKTPFGTVFYPGVTAYKEAGVILVQAGKYAEGIDIQIPQMAELIEIRGEFLFSDGNPVTGEWIKFLPADEEHFDSVNVKTDETGRFSIKLPKGDAGKLAGEFYTYIGKFEKCPRMESLIKETGSTSHTFLSETIEFDGSTPNEAIELTLPFPSCKKAKE